MLIDWFTVGAQMVNFLVLVWLLKRYLYQPVLAAIDAREKKVATTLKQAATQQTQAQATSEELRKRSEVFDREREDLMHKAADEAAAERVRLIEAARQESQLLRLKLSAALEAERAQLGRQLMMRTQAEVIAVSRKALAELAAVSLEDRMLEVFIKRLAQIPPAQALALAGPNVLVRSAFQLPAAGQARLENAIRERLSANIALRFETSPEFICGLELSANGSKLAWSVADFLSTLTQDAAALAATVLAAATSAAPTAKEAVDVH